MKKILIFVAMISIALTVNAQFFIGGQFGLGVQSTSSKPDGFKYASTSTDFNFTIGPRLGYCINDKWAVGGDILIGPSFKFGTQYYEENEDSKIKTTTTDFRWGIYPFVRYTFFTYKMFSLGVEGSIGVGSTHHSDKTKTKAKTETIKGPYTVNIQVFNIKPVMAFQFKEHFVLEAAINIIGFGYDIDVTPYQKEKNGGVTTVHNFGLNLKDLEQLKIGFIYKF